MDILSSRSGLKKNMSPEGHRGLTFYLNFDLSRKKEKQVERISEQNENLYQKY